MFTVASGESDMVKSGLKDAWTQLEITHALAVAAAIVLTDDQLSALQNVTLTPQQKLDVEKTYLLKSYGQELIDSMVFEHKSGEVLQGWPAIVLKDNRGQYRQKLDAFYLLIAEEAESILKDLKAEKRQAEHGAGRFPADVRWHTRQRRGRQFLGLHKFLDPQLWWGPADFAALCQKARKHAGLVKDAFSFTVDKMTNGQIIGEMIAQLGLDLDKKWASDQTKNGRRYKLRRITPESYRYAQMYVSYRQSLTEASNAPPHSAGSSEGALSHTAARVNTDPAIKSDAPDNSRGEAKDETEAPIALNSPPPIIADHPSGDLFSEVPRGGDQGLSLTEQGIEVVSPHHLVGSTFTHHPTQPPGIVCPGPMEIATPVDKPQVDSPPLDVEHRDESPPIPTTLPDATPIPQPVGAVALSVGARVTCWGWGAARYVVEELDEFIASITSLATGIKFTVFRSQLTPVAQTG